MTQFSMKVKDLELKASVEPQATHEQPSELSGQPAMSDGSRLGAPDRAEVAGGSWASTAVCPGWGWAGVRLGWG